MSTPPGPQSFLDAGNPLLAGGPARLDCGTIILPGGQEVDAVTIRTASTTVTVLLSGEDLDAWAKTLTGFARQRGGSRLAVPTPAESLIIGNGNGRPPAG